MQLVCGPVMNVESVFSRGKKPFSSSSGDLAKTFSPGLKQSKYIYIIIINKII